jgi:hypothetical protein
MAGPLDFLLNTSTDGSEPVGAPAFSLTKVLATAAVVLTPLTTVLVNFVSSADVTEWQIVVLIVAVLAFLAVTASADVLARARAAAGTRTEWPQYSEFAPALPATLVKDGRDARVEVVAARQHGSEAQFLVHEAGQRLRWVGQSELAFG